MMKSKQKGETNMSLRDVADNLVTAAKRMMRRAKTEEDLKIAFEKALCPLLENAGISLDERYERLSKEAKSVFRGRADAVHGQVVVEYEAPNTFRSMRRVDHAYDQLVNYLTAEVKGTGRDKAEGPTRMVGIGFDGGSIFFVRCKVKGNGVSKGRRGLEFAMDGPFVFGAESALTFVTYLRALAGVPLTAENLAEGFGPRSELAQEAVGAFVDALTNWNTPRIKVFFGEWQRLFGIVYGEQFAGGPGKKAQALAETYELDEAADFQVMLFCVHTYFALLMKFIAAELLSVSEGSFTTSFSRELVHSPTEELLARLTDIEDGGIYYKRGITNFLEGDFFRWYLEAFDSPRLQDAIREVARCLSEFEPATTTIEPEVRRDLVKELDSFEIPVYLADSVLWPKRRGQMLLSGDGVIEIPTSVGHFLVPKIWVDNQGLLMKRATPVVEELTKLRSNQTEALERFKKEGLVFPPHEKVVVNFYAHILELESDGKKGIWARFLKNVFAPMTAGQFEFVVGNPPWIRWGYLSDEYRKATLEMWQNYGLFSLKGHAARLGGGEKDFSMLFTYAAADHYLARNGTLGFLITQEVFKSKGAGEGFRKFRLGARDTLKVIKAHDLVAVQPFEGAANKTAAIFLKRRGKTEYPVPYTVWRRKKGIGRVATDLTLKQARRLLEKEQLKARPMGKSNGSWQTIQKK